MWQIMNKERGGVEQQLHCFISFPSKRRIVSHVIGGVVILRRQSSVEEELGKRYYLWPPLLRSNLKQLHLHGCKSAQAGVLAHPAEAILT